MFLTVVDRYSGWPVVAKIARGNAAELCSVLRVYFMTYGCPELLVTDGGRQFECVEFAGFCEKWKVRHHITAAYNPHSNLLAETTVKNMKRLLRENMTTKGLDNDKFVKAMLTYRNTPVRGLNVSPAEILFNKKLRDGAPIIPGKYIPRKEWVGMLSDRENAHRLRHLAGNEQWSKGTRHDILDNHTHVLVQNQVGPKKGKWSHSGSIVEHLGHNTYLVRLDGSGRVSKRRREY